MAARATWATTVNHVTVGITAPPEKVWQAILDDYVRAEKFKVPGYAVEPVSDPGAVLGGYHIRLVKDGVIDDRVIHITERDDRACRLSLWAQYRDDPDGVTDVFATYHAQEAPSGTRYALDCHARLAIDIPEHASEDHVAATLARVTAESENYLFAYLEGVRAQVEGPG